MQFSNLLFSKQVYRRQPASVEDVGYYDEGCTRKASRYVELENEVKYIYPTRLVPPVVNTRIKSTPKPSQDQVSTSPSLLGPSSAVNSVSADGATSVLKSDQLNGASSADASKNGVPNAAPKVTLQPHSSFLYTMPSMGGLLHRSLSESSSASTEVSAQSSKKVKKHKLSFPIQRRALPGVLSTRKMDIYALSDSEDERVEITKFHGGFTTDKPNPIKANEQNKLKYVVRV